MYIIHIDGRSIYSLINMLFVFHSCIFDTTTNTIYSDTATNTIYLYDSSWKNSRFKCAKLGKHWRSQFVSNLCRSIDEV